MRLFAAFSMLLSIAVFATAQAESPVFETTDDYATDARPWTHLDFANDPDNFQFTIVTDRTGGHRPGVFPAILKKVNLLQPEFVMSVGDFIEGYSHDKDRLLAEWTEIDNMIAPVEAPLFFAVGNHDIAHQVMEDVWRARSGRTHYHFVYKNVLFIVLNTEDTRHPTPEEQVELDKVWAVIEADTPTAIRLVSESPLLVRYFTETDAARIGEPQRDWVLGLLEQYKEVRWTFVFMHRPIWDKPTPGFLAIEAALAVRGYTMFAGHNHNYVHTEREGRDHMRLGTTGGGWDSTAPGSMDHVSWVTMRDGGPVFAHLVATGILAKDGVPDFLPGAEFCGAAYGIDCVYGAGSVDAE